MGDTITSRQLPKSIVVPGFSGDLSARLQSRASLDGGDNQDIAGAFSVPRARIKLKASSADGKLLFLMQLGLSEGDQKLDANEDGKTPRGVLRDASVTWKPNANIKLILGQDKVPGNRQRSISSSKLQFADRSKVSSNFNSDRDLGVQFHGKLGSIEGFMAKPILGIFTGEGRNILGSNTGGLAYVGRLELLPLGAFTAKGDYTEGDLAFEGKPKLSLGGGIIFNDNASRQKGHSGKVLLDTSSNIAFGDLQTLSADLVLKYNGWALLAEWVQQSSNRSAATAESPNLFYEGTGVMGQAGRMVGRTWELAGRYARITSSNGSFEDFSEIVFGVTKYLAGHRIKVQTDFTYFMMDAGDSWSGRFQVEMGI